MRFEEYRKYDALGLAALTKKKEVSPDELLTLAISRTEEVNPSINAVVHKLYESARESIETLDPTSTFYGVPFLMKDIGTHLKGAPMNFGCRGYKGYISEEDSIVTTHIKKSGLLIFAKTNTPEFGLTPYTEPKLFGPTRNPWNTEHSSGGSSGGSAAGVASGISPIATANDGGGSIRIPASCCGLFGLKPSRGRVSLGHTVSESWSGAVMENCVSRSVRDSAAYLDAIQGYGPGEPYHFKSPELSYLQETEKDPGTLRIAFSTEHTLGHPIDPRCVKAINDTASLLTDLGHIVEEVKLPWNENDLKVAFTTVLFGEVAAEIEELEAYLGRKAGPSDIEINTLSMGLLGKTYKASDFARAKRQWGKLSRSIGVFHQNYDVLLTPTVATPPPKIGSLLNSKTEDRMAGVINTLGLGKLLKSQANAIAEKTYDYIPYTPIANMTGQPSMSVPLQWTEDNLPMGSMFTARMGEENILFRLAAQLEKAQPWFDKIPD